MTDHCPTCGADVRVVGEGVTKRYEPTLAARVEELEGALEGMMDGTPCRLDHHGLCQEHGWTEDGDCPERRARTTLEAEGYED